MEKREERAQSLSLTKREKVKKENEIFLALHKINIFLSCNYQTALDLSVLYTPLILNL
jgi:hypothetical protein